MKVAIIGSRGLKIDNIKDFLPSGVSEIVSGGAKGIDKCAKNYAIENSITYVEFLPQYNVYGRFAPLKRNIEIIEYSDLVIAFWDGKSKGTDFVIKECKKKSREVKIVLM